MGAPAIVGGRARRYKPIRKQTSMPSQNALIGMGAAGAAVAAAGIYLAHPVFLWPKPIPPAITEAVKPAAPTASEKASPPTGRPPPRQPQPPPRPRSSRPSTS